MATDYLQLFNKKLADKLIRLNEAETIAFLNENGREADYYLENGFNESAKESLVADFCLEDEGVPVDYYGCAAHLGYFDEATSYLDLFPESEEELFVLLTDQDIDKIIDSLKKHKINSK